MHGKQDSDLILADTELERTLRSLRKTKRAESAAMTDERHDQLQEQMTAARRPPICSTVCSQCTVEGSCLSSSQIEPERPMVKCSV